MSSVVDYAIGSWNESLVREIFLPCDVEAILSIPLCSSWPADKLIRHFSNSGEFSVRSAYNVILNERRQVGGP